MEACDCEASLWVGAVSKGESVSGLCGVCVLPIPWIAMLIPLCCAPQYDIRDAEEAKRDLQGYVFEGREVRTL